AAFDLTDPTLPRWLGSSEPLPDAQAGETLGSPPCLDGGVHVQAGEGSRLWVTGRPADLYLLDVSDPTQPRLVGAYHHPSTIGGVVLTAGHVWLLDAYEERLYELNLSDPTRLAVVRQGDLQPLLDLAAADPAIPYPLGPH